MRRFSLVAAFTGCTALAGCTAAAMLVGLSGCTTGGGAGSGSSKAVVTAVTDTARPQADRDADANRKPAETLAFAGIKPGDRVVDYLAGGGYFTRLFSDVVGPKGHVYAIGFPPRPNAPANAPNPLAGIASDPHFGNVSVVAVTKITDFTIPEPVDLFWTSRNYHDVHNAKGQADLNKAVFNALKPGGIYIVLDHSAAPGSGDRDSAKLHRIDPALVKTEVTAAGFEFVGQSDVLKNPADDHTGRNAEESIRGKTDQFILKFRKPKK
ncbi:MAG TPA: hypothetical protein VGM84_11155 [Steroidobacteraceae bacterium]